ncbi:MAG: hypothetical protein IT514_00360 [Burkholderiales bacterium]|nr:hypothetical protein [Burkholderiales bacterium]
MELDIDVECDDNRTFKTGYGFTAGGEFKDLALTYKGWQASDRCLPCIARADPALQRRVYGGAALGGSGGSRRSLGVTLERRPCLTPGLAPE